MKVCIVSGRYPATKFDSSVNHKIYADKFGYDYINCNWPTKEENPYLNKIHYILSCIDFYDYVIWVDDDAFFVDFDMDIMEYSPKEKNIMSICRSPSYKELKTFFSSGQFILKSCSLSKDFLIEVLSQELSHVEKWWSDDLGFYTKGDQDIMIYLFHTDKRFMEKITLYDYKKFNSRAENLFNEDSHKPLVLHFTGIDEVKMKNYIKVQKALNLHPSLAPAGLLSNYNVSRKDQKSSLLNKVCRCLFG